jgi:5-methylthioadenosine/S-adenosylhomocysteine deaminase
MTVGDLDIINAHLVTIDDEWTEIHSGFMRLRGGRITSLGPMSEYQKSSAAQHDCSGSFVFPGLINTHTHSFQTLTRGIGEGLGVWDWFSQAIDRVVGHLTVTDARIAGQLTALEAVLSGTTTVVDYNYPHPRPGMAEATITGMREVGVRTVLARGILDTGTVHAEIVHSTSVEIAACRELATAYHQLDEDRIRIWFAPYTIFSASRDALIASRDLAREFDTGVTIHATTPSTLEAALDMYGTTDIVFENSIDFLGPRTLLVHCTHPTPEDLTLIASTGSSISHNPASNAYLGEGVAPVVEMMRLGINTSLGSDGPSSNNNQDMLQVMKLTGLLQKVEHRDPSVIMARDIVRMATMGGALALDWAEDIGSLEVGKCADFFVLNPWHPNTVTFGDPYSTLVYSATAESVDAVFVQGEAVMLNRKPTRVAVQPILEAGQQAGKALRQRAGLDP